MLRMVLVKSAEGRWKGGNCVLRWEHRVDRVLGLFSSRPNWDSHTPSPAGECVFPPIWFRGRGTRSLAGEGVEGPNSDEGTDALGIYVLCGWE
jgi:hypothetical protein